MSSYTTSWVLFEYDQGVIRLGETKFKLPSFYYYFFIFTITICLRRRHTTPITLDTNVRLLAPVNG